MPLPAHTVVRLDVDFVALPKRDFEYASQRLVAAFAEALGPRVT